MKLTGFNDDLISGVVRPDVVLFGEMLPSRLGFLNTMVLILDGNSEAVMWIRSDPHSFGSVDPDHSEVKN